MHKQAFAFMQPLVDVLLKEIKSRVQVPATSSSADSEELIRAKAKLAQAGLTLTPRKPAGDGEAPSPSKDFPAKSEPSGGLPIESHRARPAKQTRMSPRIKFASC